MESGMRSQFKSLLRAVDILDLLEEKGELSVNEVSELSKLPLSTVYKYLTVMKERGLVAYEKSLQKYRLGMRLFELGSSVQSRISIDRIARPYMEELSNQLQETVGLAVVDGNWAVYVEQVEPVRSNQIVLTLRKGLRSCLHAGAVGKSLLAYQPDEKIETFLKTAKLTKYTRKTIVDPDQLRKELRAIRSAGYAFSEEEVSQGIRAIAAPIFDGEGKVPAGLTVFGPIQRIDGPRKEKVLNLVVEYSKRISERLRGEAQVRDEKSAIGK